MYVYIIYRRSLHKYYVGQTINLDERIKRHNKGREKFTKAGTPWELIWQIGVENRSEAMRLEKQIKKRGAARFMKDLGV